VYTYGLSRGAYNQVSTKDQAVKFDSLQMTPVQAQCLPPILAGKDVIAQAKTGSGKTAAFALGILNRLNLTDYNTQALVLCPTRELADQVAGSIRQLSAAMANTKLVTLCGGKPMHDQLTSLRRSPHIVVGTPGRVLNHLEKASLDLNQVQSVVLDEADRMLDMGFQEDIQKIFSYIKPQRQTLLFSATFPKSIRAISVDVQSDPQEIHVDPAVADNKIEQAVYQVPENQKVATLIKLLQHHEPESCIIFCNQKIDCRVLGKELKQHGFYALELHGDLDQSQRDKALVQFANKSCSLLVATDVAARGIDIKELSAVVNYDITRDPEVHLHRIGRTGRAGSTGLALTIAGLNESGRIKAIEQYQNRSIEKRDAGKLPESEAKPKRPAMMTLHIKAGRKDKIRAGDILGALTAKGSGNTGLAGDQIGKISIADKNSFVAINREVAELALETISGGTIKGRNFRAVLLR